MAEPTRGPLAETDEWFVRRGLPWFVPERRAAVRANLRSRSTYLGLATIALVSLALGIGLALLSGSVAVAPATLINLTGLALIGYAGSTLGGWPIVRWAGRRTLRSLPMIIPLVTRALPMLLLFITFLFINAEVWQLSAELDGGVLWVTVLLFVIFAGVFLVARLSEEVDAFDRAVDEDAIAEACRRTPLAQAARRLARDGRAAPAGATRLSRYERSNLLLVLAVTQAVQVLLLALAVFVFFMLFGGLVMTHEVQQAWVGDLESIRAIPFAPNLSIQLFQVSVFLAAFSGFYFTVYAVTDDALRGQFFTKVMDDLARAVAVRSVYVSVRAASSP